MPFIPKPTEADATFRAGLTIGDAWSWLVLREAVLHGTSRFADFHARIGAPRSTLAARLSSLTSSNVLTRRDAEYRPTEAGADFLGCLLVAMRWGDRWVYPDAPPQPITHSGSAHPLRAVLTCGNCRLALSPSDVRAERAANDVYPARSGRNRQPAYELLERARPCSIARAVAVTGDWWSGLVIRESFFGTRHFGDFQRRIGVAPNILSARLRRLVHLGILDRVVYDEWPLRHEYRLSVSGRDFYHVPLAQTIWGRRWLGSGDREARLTHIPCGHSLRATLTCAECATDVRRDDLLMGDPSPARAIPHLTGVPDACASQPSC